MRSACDGRRLSVSVSDGAGSTLRSYLYGLGPISLIEGGASYFYHADALGSVTDLTDVSGTSVAWTEYSPFGAVRTAGSTSGAPADPLGFAGQYQDPTGLYHLRVRQYDPSTGRFTATDPMGQAGSGAGSLYAYANGNPLRYTDPSGRCFGPLIFLAPVCIGAAIGVSSYIVSTIVTNVVGNVVENRDPIDNLSRGLNPGDALISASAGALGGPIGGIASGPVRVLAGAAIGCGSTFMSQLLGGRTGDPLETGIGCAAGGTGSIFQLAKPIANFVYGSLVTTTQAITTYIEQYFGKGQLNPGTVGK